MNLINRDALKHKYEYMDGDDDTICECISILEDAPTVNAVEVVRCKDCKYRFQNNGHERRGCPIVDSSIWMCDDDFCSYGERKEKE